MSMAGLCHECARPALTVCRLCGRTTCQMHLDPRSGSCESCSTGKR
ncbi:MAG: hypothetical protein HZB92_08455 [Euryarchaeota archaeon]|nr:hypothetical protein [Euryarchaeota archaeon]